MPVTLRLERVVCSHCGHRHVDVGPWAEENHSRHLCESCHRFFFAKPANVGATDARIWGFMRQVVAGYAPGSESLLPEFDRIAQRNLEGT